MNTKLTLGKQERLKSRKAIELLFSEGRSFPLPPLRLYYRLQPGKGEIRFGAGVSSRNFKRATDRNRIKRRLREAWRTQKQSFLPMLFLPENNMDIFIIYTGKDLPGYETMYNAVHKGIKKIAAEVHPA